MNLPLDRLEAPARAAATDAAATRAGTATTGARLSESELRAAARVIATEVQRVTARHALRSTRPTRQPGAEATGAMPESGRVSP